MAHDHTVREGECIASIAIDHGFFPDTLWEHPENAELKAMRKDPYVLQPGDLVHIPDLIWGEESCDTESQHTFRRKGVPEFIELVLLDEDGEPRKDLPYRLEVDGSSRDGQTDADGALKEPISPDAERGRLLLGENYDEEIPLDLGRMNPVSELSGVKMRLTNLGYDCGGTSEVLDDQTRVQLEAFQHDHGLQVSGEPDDATQSKLEEMYGC